MAKIEPIKWGQKKSKKKWLFLKMKINRLLFKASLLTNIGLFIYLLYDNGYLTNYIKKVTPILESLKNINLPF